MTSWRIGQRKEGVRNGNTCQLQAIVLSKPTVQPDTHKVESCTSASSDSHVYRHRGRQVRQCQCVSQPLPAVMPLDGMSLGPSGCSAAHNRSSSAPSPESATLGSCIVLPMLLRQWPAYCSRFGMPAAGRRHHTSSTKDARRRGTPPLYANRWSVSLAGELAKYAVMAKTGHTSGDEGPTWMTAPFPPGSVFDRRRW